ncbi:MAG: nuclear transport factor 2 family protein [Tateyamaria sp.]|uniref:SnoaL-like domain-containing protein n=1 Tax=Tateyamaria sp. TaxID=1929288 RepID=UPI00329B8483
MTLNEIANALVAGCRSGDTKPNLDRLYSEDAVSVEPVDYGDGRAAQGLDAIKGKHDWWDSAFEVLGGSISDPMPHGDDRFAVIFEMQTKNKETGAVEDMKEVGVFHVADGKITREEFFYAS